MFNKWMRMRATGVLLLGTAGMALYPVQGMAAKSSPVDFGTVSSIETHGEGSVGALIAEPAPGALMAGDFIGKTVWNLHNQKIGKIRNLIISGQGKVQAAIVDVGHYLGRGKKKGIAIDFGSLQRVRIANTGQLQLFVNAGRTQIAAAPAFVAATGAVAMLPASHAERKPGGSTNMLPVDPSAHRSAVPDAEATVKT